MFDAVTLLTMAFFYVFMFICICLLVRKIRWMEKTMIEKTSLHAHLANIDRWCAGMPQIEVLTNHLQRWLIHQHESNMTLRQKILEAKFKEQFVASPDKVIKEMGEEVEEEKEDLCNWCGRA